MIDSNATTPEERSPTFAERLLTGLGCAASMGVLGLLLPMFSYQVWAAPRSHGSQDWSGLAAIALATVGGLGGAVMGLIAGAIWTRCKPISRALMGLLGIQIAAAAFFIAKSPEPDLIVGCAFPGVLVVGLLAILAWRARI